MDDEREKRDEKIIVDSGSETRLRNGGMKPIAHVD